MDRSQKGQEIYVESMEKSALDKTRILPFVKQGIIIDMGAGAGPITYLLSNNFPNSKIIAVDNSDDMINRLKKRFLDTNIEIVQSDARDFKYSEPIDTIILISTVHEIFSFNNYSHQGVIETFQNIKHQLKKGGRLIIRDGVQPEDEILYISPKNEGTYRRFFKFSESFRVRPLIFYEGTFQKDSFIQHRSKNFEDFYKNKFFFEMHSQDVSELLSKYFYAEENWVVELKEQFGIWSLREYQRILIELGFYIVYAEAYVLPYLYKNYYSKDFNLFKLESGLLTKTQYPPSTMILVAEKP